MLFVNKRHAIKIIHVIINRSMDWEDGDALIEFPSTHASEGIKTLMMIQQPETTLEHYKMVQENFGILKVSIQLDNLLLLIQRHLQNQSRISFVQWLR